MIMYASQLCVPVVKSSKSCSSVDNRLRRKAVVHSRDRPLLMNIDNKCVMSLQTAVELIELNNRRILRATDR